MYGSSQVLPIPNVCRIIGCYQCRILFPIAPSPLPNPTRALAASPVHSARLHPADLAIGGQEPLVGRKLEPATGGVGLGELAGRTHCHFRQYYRAAYGRSAPFWLFHAVGAFRASGRGERICATFSLGHGVHPALAWAVGIGAALCAQGCVAGSGCSHCTLSSRGQSLYLWYGQEARIYTLVALLAVLSTYGLVCWTDEMAPRWRRKRLAIYLGVTLAFLGGHYFAVLLLPVHAVVFVMGVRHRRKLALSLVSIGLLVVAGMVAAAAWLILRQPHSGSNFVALPFSLLLPDLLNAYSLGLSVNIEQVWWLDVVFGLLALLGGGWVVRCHGFAQGGWLIPGLLVVPVLLLLVINQIQPAYMNARHLGGSFRASFYCWWPGAWG